jgi:CHAT domain
LVAKSSRQRLVVSEDAPLLSARRLRGKGGLVVIENANSINDIASVIFAHCIDADVVLLPEIRRQEIRDLARELYVWSKDHSHPAFTMLKRSIRKKLGEIKIEDYDYATFFTVGVPYALALENKVPITHVLKEVDCGVFLANSLVEEIEPLVFDSALLFSPQLFESEETHEVEKILADENYVVKRIVAREATVKNLVNYGTHYPFDLMHICSHGGETDGYFVTQEYSDRDGNKHTIQFYEVVEFSPSKPKMVEVSRKIIFKSFDGFPWGSDELKPKPHYIFEDMLRAIKMDHRVRRIRTDYPIALSCHIQCSDSIHQGNFDSLAGIGHPIIFNNSCSSSHELAASFIQAGARCYIATLWSVGNETAQKASKVFYESISKESNLLKAFSIMQKSISNLRYQNVYIFWGLHLAAYRKPTHKSNLRIQGALANSYFRCSESNSASSDPRTKEHRLEAMKFLWNEMTNNVFRGRHSVLGGAPEAERHASVLPDQFSRGVTEIELGAATD